MASAIPTMTSDEVNAARALRPTSSTRSNRYVAEPPSFKARDALVPLKGLLTLAAMAATWLPPKSKLKTTPLLIDHFSRGLKFFIFPQSNTSDMCHRNHKI
jgi:hypothetical protein